jgi:hypothetical protein
MKTNPLKNKLVLAVALRLATPLAIVALALNVFASSVSATGEETDWCVFFRHGKPSSMPPLLSPSPRFGTARRRTKALRLATRSLRRSWRSARTMGLATVYPTPTRRPRVLATRSAHRGQPLPVLGGGDTLDDGQRRPVQSGASASHLW